MKQSIRSLSRLWLWVLALLVAQQTQAQLLTEDFPNSGTLTAVSSWTQTGSSATNPIIAGQPNLTYAGLSTSGNAAILTTTGQDVSRAYTAQTSGTVYASCLVNVTSAQATGDYFFHLASSTGGTLFYDRLFVKSVTGGIQFGIAKNSNTPAYAPTIYTLNTTYFIVIKYTYNPGTGDDVASFFINPVLGGSEPTSAATDAAGTDASSSAGIGAINLRQGTATNAPNVVVDYIRVGTNWTDVTQAPAPVATLSVNPTTLSGFSTTQGTPSATQTYALTGSTLSADVTVTAPVGYEISQDGTNFQNTITVIRSNGSVNATITVRLTGASAGSPSGAITNGSGSVSANVTVSGTVSAPNSPSLSVSPTTLAGFSTTQGTASAIQTYALSGSNLTSDVTVTAPAGYQVSLDGTTFQNTVTATQTNGAVNATVSVQLAGTSAGIFSGSITNASAGVATVSVPVSGTVGSNSPYTPIVLARSSVGQTVTIAGRVTATNQLGSRQIYIQDNTGGIVVYSGSTGTDLSTLVQLGDSVQARGPITVFNGFTEITSAATTNFTIVSGAGTRVPTPIAITPDQLPNYQGQLVSIANASITPVASTFTGGTNYTITANGQSATLRISANSPLAGAGQPANPVSVTGIADRFVSGATSTGTNGLQLQPRILADIPGSTPAQDLTCTAGMSNSTLGTEQTLDIATWNMEFFGADAGTIICPNGNLNYNDMGPTNEDLQQSNAVTVLSKLKADIVGVEEVSDLNRLAATVASLPGSYSYTCSDRFSYYFQDECTQTPSGNPPTVFGPTSLAQKVCVIYNRATVTPVLAETKALLTEKYSYPSANNWSSGRLPFLFVGDVTINGVTQRVHVVTIHAKSGSNSSDYTRRKQDIIDLKANLDATYPNAKLIILGDYNDKLDGSIASGQPSSYKPFVDDASNYRALTLPLENNGCSTFNSSASFIDHMIISNDLAPAAISNSTYVLQPFSIPNYGNTTSDHNPVVTRFDLTKLTTPVTALTVTATANPTQLLTSGSTTITASVSGGTAPYSYSFTGPGTITANGNTATVSSLSAGVQTFTVTATDATTPTAQTSFTTVSVTVTQGNRPPVAISSLLSGTVTVGQSFSVDARTLFTDPDGDSLLITVAVLPAGFTFNNNILSGRFTQAGQYGVDILVYDASSVGYGRFTLTVTANTAPVVANAIAPQSATVGSAYTLSLAGVFTDAETPSQLGLSVSGLPAGLSFTAPSTISGTPLASGVNTVTVTATDPGSLSASTTFTLTASPTSSAPMILVSQSSLNEFRYTTQSQGSGAQSYTVSATGLSQSLTVVAPSAYFVSIDNYTFDQQVVLPAPGGVVSPKRIYVILGTGTAGTYNGVVKNTSGGVTSTVAVNGTVLQATLSAQPTALNNLTTIAGTPSTVQTYTVTTLNQTGISVVAPVGVEIRTGNRPFSTSLTIGYSYSTVSVPVDVRLTGANAGPITGTITHKSAYGQADLVASVTINGFVSTPGTPTEPFSITGVTLGSCTTLSVGERQISFSPQYAGLTGESISFRVANESVPTTAAGPYSLKLYTDNPVISLRAMQGSGSEVSYAYNWLAACNNTTPVNPTNTAPVVANAIAPQSATAGSAYTLSLAGVFTDSETPNQLSLSATGLPAGLSLNGTSISGTPSTTVGSPYTVSVTATDPGSLSTSTSFVLTVSPAATTTPGNPTVPFSITGVTLVSCTTLSVGERQISFSPQYAGVTGEAISFRVANESTPTTAAGPYSLKLYTDNPVISLRAVQGSGSEVSYAYNWLAACNTTTPVNPTNTAPVVANAIAPQSATVGSAYTLSLAGVFTDAETPNQLTLSASGLPAGLSLSGMSISGTPSTTVGTPYTVSVTATDPGNLSASTSFVLTVGASSGVNPTVPFSITGVTLVSCSADGVGARRISFNPQYAGVTGEVISFRVVNESEPTTAAGPYSLRLYTDNPVINLRAMQGNGSEVSYAYNWLAACTANGRIRAQEQAESLTVTVLGNPVVGETVDVEIRGAGGQSVRVLAVDGRGHTVSDSRIEQATGVEKASVRLGRTPGIYLLQISTASQQQTVKLIRE